MSKRIDSVKLFIAVFLLLSVAAACPGCGGTRSGEKTDYRRPAVTSKVNPSASLPQMENFSFTGYADNDGKKWEVTGRTAVLCAPEIVKLSDVLAHSYDDGNVITVTAERGVFDRTKKVLELTGSVIVTTDGGARLVTETLTWTEKDGALHTSDRCVLEKENLKINAVGMEAKTGPGIARFRNEVMAIFQTGEVITSGGPLDIHYREDRAVFYDNVKMSDKDGILFADRMEIDFDRDAGRIIRLATFGNVRREHILKRHVRKNRT